MLSCSVVSDFFATLWTVSCQGPLSMGFSRQEYWSGLPFPSPGEFSRPRNRTQISCIAGRFFTGWATIAILTDVRWYFTAVFIFISMMISAVEHLFICLLVICCSSSLENMYLGSLFFFKSGCFFFCELSSLLFWILPLTDTWFANIFFHSAGCHCVLSVVSFARERFAV